ncbi:MAG: sugar kinase [Pseudomonadota bacterium]
MTGPPDLIALGECMAELSGVDGERRLGFGGDTLNTALLTARMLGAGRVAYMTRLGDDPYSTAMLEAWHAEGIDCRMTEVEPAATVGLYAIETGADGERSFTYWRSAAPARGLMTEGAWQARIEALGQARAIYLSGITLAILPEAGRHRLIDVLGRARAAGALVAVDPNHRPRLWRATEAAQWIHQAYAVATLVLSSPEEEASLFGDGDPFERLAKIGVPSVVLKAGAAGAESLADGARVHSPAAVTEAIDTTGAGDAFNAGVLAHLLSETEGGLAAATRAGCALGALAVRHWGAIPPQPAMSGWSAASP